MFANTHHFEHIAIGNKIDFFVRFVPKIIVFGNHKQIATAELVFALHDTASDAIVVKVGALVGTCEYDSIFDTHATVRTLYFVNQIHARQRADVVKIFESKFGMCKNIFVGKLVA